MKTTLNLALVAALVFLTGCGSLTSRWRGQRGEAYPGVRMDVEHATHYTSEGEWIALFDIPLSAVVDTLFLPYDLTGTDKKAEALKQDHADAAH
jgi:uncharacterized protein YceK